MLQHGTWQIFKGDSTSSAALVAEIKPSLVSVGGKKIRVTLNGKEEPEFVIEVSSRLDIPLDCLHSASSHAADLARLLCTVDSWCG